VPQIQANYDADHPLPVLVRTKNATAAGLNDVFDITSGKTPEDWSKNWGNLASGGAVQSGQIVGNGDVTEVVAENILGWKIEPIYIDFASGKGDRVIDGTTSTRYFDKYVTADLRYVKGTTSLTSADAPRALGIRIASVPASALTRLTALPGWGNVRADPQLFTPYDLNGSALNNLLKKNIRLFNSIYFLSSRVP
jgi:hypothetical protein